MYTYIYTDTCIDNILFYFAFYRTVFKHHNGTFFFHENNPWCKRGNLPTRDKLNDIQSITSYPFSLLVDHLQFLVVLLDYGAIELTLAGNEHWAPHWTACGSQCFFWLQ
jgi:hypothetical protein